MTVAEIKASDKPFLRASDIAEVIGCGAQAIRDMARTSPEKLGFPVSVMGTRTRIPRKSFLVWMGEDTTDGA